MWQASAKPIFLYVADERKLMEIILLSVDFTRAQNFFVILNAMYVCAYMRMCMCVHVLRQNLILHQMRWILKNLRDTFAKKQITIEVHHRLCPWKDYLLNKALSKYNAQTRRKIVFIWLTLSNIKYIFIYLMNGLDIHGCQAILSEWKKIGWKSVLVLFC